MGYAANDIVLYCDEREWVYPLVCKSIEKLKKQYRVLTTETTPREGWDLLKSVPYIVFLWDGKTRTAADMCEFIYDMDPHFNFSDKVIVVVVNPLREDIIQLSEFGVRKIVRARQRDVDMAAFQGHLADLLKPLKLTWETVAMDRLLDSVASIGTVISADSLSMIEKRFAEASLSFTIKSPKEYDFKSCVLYHRGKKEEAKSSWYKLIEQFPNYFQGYQRLYEFFMKERDFERALTILRRIQSINPKSARRLIDFGEAFLGLKEFEKAKNSFEKALDRDHLSSGARSGLAKLYFEQEDMESARKIMKGVPDSKNFAASLNRKGVELVQRGMYEEALQHYSKAQYVLPTHDQDHKLIFNIALCCYRWNQVTQAVKFLHVALAKSPDYERAKELLAKILGSWREESPSEAS